MTDHASPPRHQTADTDHAAPPPRARGVIALDADACTSCMICARECPDWCIHIESRPERVDGTATGRGRARARNVLERFAIDYSLCLYCGICVEVCPFDALFWSPAHDYPGAGPTDLLHEKDRLADWLPHVPPQRRAVDGCDDPACRVEGRAAEDAD